MNNQALVVMLLVVVMFILIMLEIVLNLNNNPNDTSNIILWEYTKGKGLFIPFAIGAIVGHLVLGTEKNPLPEKVFNITSETVVVIGLLIISALLSILARLVKIRSRAFITLILLLGMAYGHFFWSMND